MKSRAFKYGEGFFTTIRVEKSTAVWLEDHLERLTRSLAVFGLGELDSRELQAATDRLIAARGISSGYLRIQLWDEQGKVAAYIEGEQIEGKAAKPCSIAIAAHHRLSSDPLLEHKSCNYLINLLTYRQARQDGFAEVIFLNERQEVCEGSRSNIFWFHHGVLHTPDPACGLLPGICRSRVIEIACGAEMEVITGMYRLDDVRGADEIFLTNSLRGIMPVNFLDGANFDSGELTAAIARLLKADIERYIEIRQAGRLD